MSYPPAANLTVDAATEPVMAWRAWALTGRADGTGLLLRPVAGRSRPWPPRRPAEAACKHARLHAAPSVNCSCGLHGSFAPDILRKTRTPAVLGRVALWGRVIEHELGYRAEFAYPQLVRLVCQFCFWQWGAPNAQPSIVGWYPRDELVPLCWPHLELAQRYGMTPRRILGAGPVEQLLRETYVVDLLPA